MQDLLTRILTLGIQKMFKTCLLCLFLQVPSIKMLTLGIQKVFKICLICLGLLHLLTCLLIVGMLVKSVVWDTCLERNHLSLMKIVWQSALTNHLMVGMYNKSLACLLCFTMQKTLTNN